MKPWIRFEIVLILAFAAKITARNVHVIELTKTIREDQKGVQISPTIYGLDTKLRHDARMLFNTIEIRDVRQVTSAFLPSDFDGIDALQGRRVHAFVAPFSKEAPEHSRYQWSHDDFDDVTQHSVVILMDANNDADEEHEHDLLTPAAVDCLIHDKRISVLITNHRYIDGIRSKSYMANCSGAAEKCNLTSESVKYKSLELAFLNNKVTIIISAAPLLPSDAKLMAAGTPFDKRKTGKSKVTAYDNNSRNRRASDSAAYEPIQENFDTFFYSYFLFFQPDKTVPVALAGVTLLNYTTKAPTSISHPWYPMASSLLPTWPGTPKPLVTVKMKAHNSRAILFSEQRTPEVGEQHPAFFSMPLTPVAAKYQEDRPQRPTVRMRFAEHFGTHVEAPFHMLPNSTTVEDIPKEKLFSKCCYRVDLTRKIKLLHDTWATNQGVSLRDYDDYGPVAGSASHLSGCVALIQTGNSQYWDNSSLYVNEMKFPGLSQRLTSYLVDKKSSGDRHFAVGIDTLSLDPGKSIGLPSRVTAAFNDALVLENMGNLDSLPPNGKPVPCVIVPMRIEKGSASPVQVVALLGGGENYSFYTDSSPIVFATSMAVVVSNLVCFLNFYL